MAGTAVVATHGLKGFDANATVSASDARAFAGAGYAFAIRYVRRENAAASDVSAAEINDLFNAGLAVMPVQHVASETSWTPTDDDGRLYGQNAAEAGRELGLPAGTTVWLDLEGVAAGTSAEQVISYCNLWYDAVAAAGFQPGLYVGWQAGLTATQLYSRLEFARYWASYNLNADQYPATCGVCMKQHAAGAGDKPDSIAYEIDTDVINGDLLGRFPTLFAPAEWPA